MKEISFKEILQRIEEVNLPSFGLVVGIGRGGIVPASLIAQKLKADLRIIDVVYRDDENRPLSEEPRISSVCTLPEEIKSVLLVDDVSVTGKTLKAVKDLLGRKNVKTLTLRGEGDWCLFPELKTCVKWPWQTE